MILERLDLSKVIMAIIRGKIQLPAVFVTVGGSHSITGYRIEQGRLWDQSGKEVETEPFWDAYARIKAGSPCPNMPTLDCATAIVTKLFSATGGTDGNSKN